jgi:hypothetical protein
MPAITAYDYAVVRVVPRVDRGEWINVGVVLFCRPRRFLAAMIELDRDRLRAIAPKLDLDEVQQHLDVFPRIAKGGKDAGPIGILPLQERYHWLVAPRSAIIQVALAHTGRCADPAAEIERLMDMFVRPLPADSDR